MIRENKFYITAIIRSLSHKLHTKLETLVEATLPTLRPIVHVYRTAVGSIDTVQGAMATILTLSPEELLTAFADAYTIPCPWRCVIAHSTFGHALHDTPTYATHKYTRVQRQCILLQHPTGVHVLLGTIGRHRCLCIVLNVFVGRICLEHSVNRFFVKISQTLIRMLII